MKADPTANAVVAVGKAQFGNALPLALIAGPCVLEVARMRWRWRRHLKSSPRGARSGLFIKHRSIRPTAPATRVRADPGSTMPWGFFRNPRTRRRAVLTDVHEAVQCARGGSRGRSADPAFLSRQTDLLVAAAKTGRVVNVKKGSVPRALGHEACRRENHGRWKSQCAGDGAWRVVRLQHAGVRHARVADLARETGAPVIFDATHSVQQPGGQGTTSGGQREYVPVLARAAVAVGVAGVFIETHHDPDKAPQMAQT